VNFFNATPEHGRGGVRRIVGVPGCAECQRLRMHLAQLRQAYRELEDALAVADARSIPESITPRDRALTVAIYERAERRQRADE
jgi:hypothetical protein